MLPDDILKILDKEGIWEGSTDTGLTLRSGKSAHGSEIIIPLIGLFVLTLPTWLKILQPLILPYQR